MIPPPLPTIWGTYMKLVTKYQISAIKSCWEKCAYMFNVYKNQLSRQTGSRTPMGSKTLSTIWGTYMTLVTKYQISVINSCWEKCAYMFNATKNILDGRTEVKQYTPLRGGGGYNYFFLMKSYWSEISNYRKFHTFKGHNSRTINAAETKLNLICLLWAHIAFGKAS